MERCSIPDDSGSATLCSNARFDRMNMMRHNPVQKPSHCIYVSHCNVISFDDPSFECKLRTLSLSLNCKGFVGFKLLLKSIESGKHMVRSNDPIYSKDIEVKYELYCHQTDPWGTQMETWRHEGSHVHKRRNYHTLSYFQHPIDFDSADSEVAAKRFYELTVAEERIRPNASLCFGCHIEIEQCKKKKKKPKKEKIKDVDPIKDMIKTE